MKNGLNRNIIIMIIKLNCIAFKLLHSETQKIFIHILDWIGWDDDVG